MSRKYKRQPDRIKYYKHFYPIYSWDKLFEINKENSHYYNCLVRVYGKETADYYWKRREQVETIDHVKKNVCDDIISKCEEFLKSRGVDTSVGLYKGENRIIYEYN